MIVSLMAVSVAYVRKEGQSLAHLESAGGFSPPHSDIGVDSDSDGFYDSLVVNATLYVSSPGFFLVYGNLYDSNGSWIGDANNNIDLGPGVQTVSLFFSGIQIWRHGMDGPYEVDFSLYDDTLFWLDYGNHTTAPYLRTEFKHPPAAIEPPHYDYGLDTDSDGLYNYLVVGVNVSVMTAGDYEVYCSLYDEYNNYIYQQSNWTHLDLGLGTIFVSFDGLRIHGHAVDGEYHVGISLYIHDMGGYLEDGWYTTSSYLWADFQTPPAEFAPPHLDHGLDSGSDGLFDYLVVEVSVDVSIAGSYWVLGDLFDQNHSYIASFSNDTYLDAGMQIVEVRIDGWKICRHGDDGPYNLSLVLEDESCNWLTSGYHLTSAYLWSEFQTPSRFLPPYSDHGLDTDGDGMWNYLVIEAVVDITFSSTYSVSSTLYDQFGGWIIDASNNSLSLGIGVQTVELRYDGLRIMDHGLDGPYSVNLVLLDSTYMWLDDDYYNTSAYLLTEFQKPYATLEPPYSDHGLDTGTDGLFDYLVVETHLNVTHSGSYDLSAQLMSNDSMIWIGSGDNYTYLDPGLHVVEVRFDGVRIWNSGVDGQYKVSMSVVWSENWTWLDSDTYFTGPYLHTEFQTPPASLEPPHIDYGLDTDSDGMYNYLVIDARVNVSVAGDYYIDGFLWDSNGTTIESRSAYAHLGLGLQTIELRFDGMRIRSHGVDGPYTVMIHLQGGVYDLGYNYTTTAAYQWEEFQRPPVEFEPPHSDYGLDIDSDGLYEFLVIAAVVNATHAGTYRIYGLVQDVNGSSMPTIENDTYLEPGLQVVELRLEASSIRMGELDGPFRVELLLENVVNIWLDTDIFYTSAYRWEEFQMPSSFSSPHTDFGRDTDGDGLFDELVISISVNVTIPGYYLVRGGLQHNDSFGLGYNENYSYLEAGLQTVELRYRGWSIYSYGFDGPYEASLELVVFVPWWIVLDLDSYNTSAYLWNDFDPPLAAFAPPHSDRAVDDDSDGYFEYLVVDAGVNVSEAGYYDVEGEMHDSVGGYVCYSDSEGVYLSAGSQTVELLFSGPAIFEHGMDGTYEVTMSLYESEGDWLSDSNHTTGYHMFSEFQIASSFEPPCSDYGLDADGDGMFNFLVVNVSVNITLSGTYEIEGSLCRSDGSTITGTYDEFVLAEGLQAIELRFDGFAINRFGANGPYLVHLYLENEHNSLDYMTYNTSTFGWSEFQASPFFSPPHSDYGLDDDLDGAFEFLVVEAVVNITSNQTYVISGQLTDGLWHFSEVHSNTTYLHTGLNTVELRYEGWKIRENGVSGPFRVYLTLATTDVWIDSDEFYTFAYLPAEFEEPPPALQPPWLADFESGDLGGVTGSDWDVYGSTPVGVSSQASEPGSLSIEPGMNSMFTSGGYVEVTSYYINLSGQATSELRVWIQRGDNISSDSPEAGDDLEIWYENSQHDWRLLDTLYGSGVPGEAYVLTYPLPSDALHSQLRIRFVQTDGDGPGTDYWFIDNVYVGPPVAPHASFDASPSSGYILTVFAFDASASSDLEDPIYDLEVRWDWDNDGVWDTGWSTTKTSSHQFSYPGTYYVGLEVRDTLGLANQTLVSVVVADTAPLAFLSVTPSSGDGSTVFEFNASLCSDAEDPPGVLEVRWDWESDGTWDTGWSTDKVATHQFLIAGNYTITVEVRDNQGLSNTTTVEVEVVEPIPEFSGMIVPIVMMLLLVSVIARGRIRRRL
jgi:hypothetical protein